MLHIHKYEDRYRLDFTLDLFTALFEIGCISIPTVSWRIYTKRRFFTRYFTKYLPLQCLFSVRVNEIVSQWPNMIWKMLFIFLDSDGATDT